MSVCLYGNNIGCTKITEAYYKYEKIDEIVSKYDDKIKRAYPAIVSVLPLVAIVKERTITTPIYNGIFIGVKQNGNYNDTKRYYYTLKITKSF